MTNNVGNAKHEVLVSAGFHDESGHTAAIIICAGRSACLHDTSKMKEPPKKSL
jgi:hypothetical protein